MERVVRRVERAQAEVIAVENRLTTLREALAERQEAQTLAQTADAAARAARATHEARQQEKEAQDTTLAEASAALAAADEEQRAALRAEAARDGAERRAELIQRITDAEAARVRQENAAAAAKIGPDAAALARLDRLSAELGAAIAARNATATQIVARYEAGHEGMMRLEEGATLPDAEALPVPHVARVIIDGIGTLEIRPGASESGADAVERATEALAKTLAGLGADTLEAARSAARSRDEARRTEAEETAVLRSLAPEGIETLRERLARIPTPEDSVEAPDLASAEATLTSARSAHDHARALSDAATERLSDARAIAARCDADSTSAHERLSRAKSAAERLGEITEETLSQQMTDATQALEAAEALARAKAEGAPDLEAAQATLSRLEAVDTQARNEIARLRPLLATLDERIARASGDAVEERLAETAETLESARAELARIDREVAVLKRLEAALDAARSQARDRYFTPVANELKPLLRLLWPEAEMTWGHDTLLPEALIRDGAPEPVEILSGGTQEQVSLLVRLAFARMLAASGRSAPVILDDALVFTDDDRIVRMFDALHRQAGDLQILVLSCRQRAFRDLGGNTLRLGSA